MAGWSNYLRLETRQVVEQNAGEYEGLPQSGPQSTLARAKPAAGNTQRGCCFHLGTPKNETLLVDAAQFGSESRQIFEQDALDSRVTGFRTCGIVADGLELEVVGFVRDLPALFAKMVDETVPSNRVEVRLVVAHTVECGSSARREGADENVLQKIRNGACLTKSGDTARSCKGLQVAVDLPDVEAVNLLEHVASPLSESLDESWVGLEKRHGWARLAHASPRGFGTTTPNLFDMSHSRLSYLHQVARLGQYCRRSQAPVSAVALQLTCCRQLLWTDVHVDCGALRSSLSTSP